MVDNADYILELLEEYGMIEQEQIDEGWEKVAESDGKLGIIEALQELEYVDEFEMMAMLAQQYGLETLDLASYTIPPEVIELMDQEVVQKYCVVPIMENDGILTIAMSDPTDMSTLDSIRYILGKDLEAVIAPKDQIQKVIDTHFSTLADSVNSFLGEMDDGASIEAQLMAEGQKDEATTEDDTPIIRLVSLIIIDAFKADASDIHLEPLEKRYRVRYRIDGVLREVESPPKYLQANVTSRLKIMAKLDISEKRVPQDGRISLKIGDKAIDLRVSTVPTTHGESIVMRILDKSSIQLDIPDLGFYPDDHEIITTVLNYPDGIFLVTGPTGSGKTTSLYAFLNSINTPSRKIITVEDPIEYQLDGINQVEADKRIGMTFGNALRAMLRQAPNIIMVGEIRDMETAEIAINASLTGHLVFSTLHTNDAPSAVTRMIDMGVAPFLVASAVKAIMAQRLVRRLCKNCKAPYTPDPALMATLKLDDEFLANSTLMKGRGCSACGNTGYKGRMGIYEIFTLSESIQHLIFDSAPAEVIRVAARKEGLHSLREDSIRKAAAGSTTLEETVRVTVAELSE